MEKKVNSLPKKNYIKREKNLRYEKKWNSKSESYFLIRHFMSILLLPIPTLRNDLANNSTEFAFVQFVAAILQENYVARVSEH